MEPVTEGRFHRGKTVWDWAQLLIIPATLVIFGFWLSNRATTERARQDTLDQYYDRIGELLLAGNLRSSEQYSEVRSLARAQTLAALRVLDSDRRAQVIRFLADARLITNWPGNRGSKPVIDLSYADLRGADLRGIYGIAGAELSWANLSESNLHDLDLQGTTLVGVNLTRADISEAYLSNADLSLADLSYANLSDAILYQAVLRGTDFRGANLRGADFRESFLTSLYPNRDVRNLTQSQLNETGNYYNSSLPDGILQDTRPTVTPFPTYPTPLPPPTTTPVPK